MFIEIIKIVVGLLIAGVAGTWTLYTWKVNENTAQRRSNHRH